MLRKYVAGAPLLLLVILLLSACNQLSIGIGGPSLTPAEVLQKSATAMGQLKSSQVDLRSSNRFQTTPSNGGTPVNNVTTIRGNGVQALPNQMQMSFLVNNNTRVAEVMQGDKIYIQNAQGQWYVMSRSQLQKQYGNPFAGISFDQNTLMGLAQHATIQDRGVETVNGQSLRRITATLDQVALRQLLSNNQQLKNYIGEQNVRMLLDNLKSFNATVDLWIDESQFYLHRTELKMNLAADTSKLGANAPKSATDSLDMIVDLSKFNEPVMIATPANAMPTNNPIDIFSTQKCMQHCMH